MASTGSCRIAAYTRNTSEGYSVFLGESVHFALSLDGGKNYKPLNKGYGVLFPECHFNEDNGIISAGVRDVEIRMADGRYVITGREIIRRQIKEQIFMRGFDVEETGKFIRWSTSDFITFSAPEIHSERYPDASAEAAGEKLEHKQLDIRDGDAVAIAVPDSLAEKISAFYRTIKYSHVNIPRCVLAKSPEDIEGIAARVMYTDGSSHVKRVKWDMSAIDFEKPGRYAVKGKIQRRHFPFPVQERPWGDPIITYYGGKYYFIGTDDREKDTRYEVRTAETPEELFSPDVIKSTILDTSSYNGRFDSTFWAPEFHITGGKMRLFGALGQGDFNPQSYVMTLKDGGDIMEPADWSEPQRCVMPDGRYLSENPLGDGKNGITLDMTYFEAGGRGYVVWSYRTWEGTDSGSMLMIAETNPDKPWQLITFPALLCRPKYGWENVDGTDNNEGPYAIVTADKVYLSYSGGNAIGDSYAVGMLTADACADLTDISVWEKSPYPVLASNFVSGQYGSGHNGFFVDEYGDTYITYHGHKTVGNSDRINGIRRVHFTAEGAPLLSMSEEQDIPVECCEVAIEVTVPDGK